MPFSAQIARRLLLAALLLTLAPSVGAVVSMEEVYQFGSNPGQLRMYRYLPARWSAPLPLVVTLHGCLQNARSFAEASGWMQYSDRYGFALLLPEQRLANNSGRCFNWFDPEDTARDGGEAFSIRQMIARMQADYPVDPQKIYVTGLSAGAAMAGALLASYPEVFAGGALLAGIPYGCAKNLAGSVWCMQGGKARSAKDWARAVQEATAHVQPPITHWPRVSIWQGETDRIVDPANAQELLKQWTEVAGIDQEPEVEEFGNGYVRYVYQDAQGRPLVETYTLFRVGHGVPVAPEAKDEACGRATDYMLPIGVCAVALIARFWGLVNP